MASSNFSVKMFKMLRALSASNRIVLPAVCVTCGSAIMYYASTNSNKSSLWSHFVKSREVYAASSHHHQSNLSDVGCFFISVV